MEPGHRVFDRYEIVSPLPDIGEVERHVARDTITGDEVELIRPSALAALRPNARERFREAWRTEAQGPLPPARLPALAVGEVEGRPAAIRPRVSSAWTAQVRLAEADLPAIVGWLMPALLVAPPPDGLLTPEDVVIDPNGRPWLAPTGVVPKFSLQQPPVYDAPEPTELASDRARYGLGVLMYRSVVGSLPFDGTADRERLRDNQRHPHAPRATAPHLSEKTAQLLATLVDPRAEVRATVAIPPPLAPPVVTLPSAAPRPPVSGDLPRTESLRPSAGARRDQPLPPYVVVLDNTKVSDGGRTRLAALLDLPADAFRLPPSASPEVLVMGATTETEGLARLQELSPAGAPLQLVSTEAPPLARQAMLGGGVAALVLGPLLALFIGMLALPFAVLPGLVAALWGARQARESNERAARLKQTGQYIARGPRAAPALADGAARVSLARKAQAVRRAILQADLADAPRLDFLEAVDALDLSPRDDAATDAHIEALDELLHAVSALQGPAETARTGGASSSADAVRRAREAAAAARKVRIS